MAFGRKLRIWRGLSPAVRRAVRHAVPTLLLVTLSIRLLGFLRSHRLASRAVAQRSGRDDPDAVSEGVRLAARALPWRPKCLERSLALTSLLRRRGFDAHLRIGVRKTPKGAPAAAEHAIAIEAHAWVEIDGRAIGDRADVHERFLAFDDDLADAAAALSALRR